MTKEERRNEAARRLAASWLKESEEDEAHPFNVPTGPLHEAIEAASEALDLGDDPISVLPDSFIALAEEKEITVEFPDTEKNRLVQILSDIRYEEEEAAAAVE